MSLARMCSVTVGTLVSNIEFADFSKQEQYSNFHNYAPPLDEKRGINAEKVSSLFSEDFFGAYFGLVLYIWELIDVTEKVVFQM